MDRRSFIKLTAVTGTSTALASCGNPEHQFIRFLPDDELAPGIAEWKPSVCPLCASGCGVIARVMDTDGQVIPGLFAAGELVGGLFYFNYPGGTGLMSGAVFGKIAGAAAAGAAAADGDPA